MMLPTWGGEDFTRQFPETSVFVGAPGPSLHGSEVIIWLVQSIGRPFWAPFLDVLVIRAMVVNLSPTIWGLYQIRLSFGNPRYLSKLITGTQFHDTICGPAG